MQKGGYVYIMSNKNRTVLYNGVVNDLQTRIYQHRHENGPKFTSKYNCHDLLFFEVFDFIEEAIAREKQLKNWLVV